MREFSKDFTRSTRTKREQRRSWFNTLNSMERWVLVDSSRSREKKSLNTLCLPSTNELKSPHLLHLFFVLSSQTACGDYVNSKTDLVVGVSSDIFGDGSNCGRQVTITAPNGKSASGTLVDSGADQINLSEALFKKFYNLGKGQFTGTYSIQ